MNSIDVHGLSKSYPVYRSNARRLAELLLLQTSSFHEDFWALQDVSFSVAAGETFGIVGVNGSGKSTLLQVIAGILNPTKGSVETRGRISALLELGSGFNPEFSGRENVFLNSAILGMPHAEIERRFAEIEDFAGIGDFIEQPVKTYSSGMVMRLAFSVAIHVDPEILIVDEALAVGDMYFRQRCLRRIHQMRDAGTTILFVSHSPTDIKAFCDRCLWLDKGRVVAIGPADHVLAEYLAATFSKTVQSGNSTEKVRQPEMASVAPVAAARPLQHWRHRYGSGRGELLGASVLDQGGVDIQEAFAGSRVTMRITAVARVEVERPIVGFLLRNAKGETIFGTNTLREKRELESLEAGETISCDFSFAVPEIVPGRYGITVSISDGTLEAFEVLDLAEDAVYLTVSGDPSDVRGYLRLPCRVSIER